MSNEIDKFKMLLDLALHPERLTARLTPPAAPVAPVEGEPPEPLPVPEAPVETPLPVVPVFNPPPVFPPDALTPSLQQLIAAVQRQGELLSAQVASLAGFLPLMGGRAQNVVTIKDQNQARSYSVQKAFTQSVGPVTVGAGVTVTLNTINPLVGSFAIVGVRFDAATNTAGLVKGTALINGDPVFQWLGDPIPIWWPATDIDLDEFGGVRVVPNTAALILGATFHNTSAIDQVVSCTWRLSWLQEDEIPPEQGGG